jgi:putative ABC transport system substrate-binding protein
LRRLFSNEKVLFPLPSLDQGSCHPSRG